MVRNTPVKICYVILHYQVLVDTQECVQSIFEKDEILESKKIIIVDNNSPNKSGKELKKLYRDIEHVEVLLSNKNLGFANGNNLGCQYAKEQYAPDFLVVLNNDIELVTPNFGLKLIEMYRDSPFDFFGPRIISKYELRDQNPEFYAVDNLYKCIKAITKETLLLILNYLNVDQYYLSWDAQKRIESKKVGGESTRFENIKLHGSFLVFSKKYYEKFEYVFDRRTFMYMEEDILNARRILHGLNVYCDFKCEVLHKEDSATNAVFADDNLKRRFINRHSIKSMWVLTKIFLKRKAN